MKTVVVIAVLFLVVGLASSQEPAATIPQPGTVTPPTSDAGSGNSAGGGIGGSAASGLYHVGVGVSAPKAVYTPDPAYPDDARRAGYSGTVVLWLVVDTDGTAKQIKVLRAMGMGLDEAAMATVQRWRFQPSMKNGQPVAVQVNVEMNFRLDGATPVVPLHSSRDGSAKPPEFPGADLTRYPLLAHIQHITVTPAGSHYVVRANASFGSDDAGDSPGLSIVCESKKTNCSVLWRGHYPARWIVPNQQLEIVGQRGNNSGWEKADYTIEPAPAP